MTNATDNRAFSEIALAQLNDAGLCNAEAITSKQESASFGNAEAVFRVGSLLIRIVRDRGQQFVDIGSMADPTKFHQFDDVEIAMGWRKVEEVIEKRDPELLDSVLARLAAKMTALQEAFSGSREHLTRARVEQAARERGQAFTSRLLRT